MRLRRGEKVCIVELEAGDAPHLVLEDLKAQGFPVVSMASRGALAWATFDSTVSLARRRQLRPEIKARVRARLFPAYVKPPTQAEQIAALLARVAELEARMG